MTVDSISQIYGMVIQVIYLVDISGGVLLINIS